MATTAVGCRERSEQSAVGCCERSEPSAVELPLGVGRELVVELLEAVFGDLGADETFRAEFLRWRAALASEGVAATLDEALAP